MAFVVSARKYRPVRFEEVVGQAHVSQTLKKALQTDHLAHAFLFCGPRGVGKTTCARILAKTINCRNPTADYEPCGECDSCKAFAETSSFNILELDAASNNSVEHIRSLVEQVRFQPQQGKYKVFIIDEVHMLSQAAFNAFLKTLEEPPPYAIFILATTEKHKIIPTILSRCQIFDFRRIEVRDTVAHLRHICEQEGIEAEGDALHLIAQKSDGALRDALSIFDRIVASSGKSIRYEDVITNLNVLDYDYFFRFTDALLSEDMRNVQLIFDDIYRNGFEGDQFIIGLAEHFRNLLVCKDAETLRLLEVSDSLRERYKQQAALSPPSFLLTALNLCNDCDVNYKMARHKRLHVELCLYKMCFIQSAIHVSQMPAGEGVEKKSPDLSVSSGQSAVSSQQLKGGSQELSEAIRVENEAPVLEKKLASIMPELPPVASPFVDRVAAEHAILQEPQAVFEKNLPAATPAQEEKKPSLLRKSVVDTTGSLQKLYDLDAEVEASHVNETAASAALLTLEDLRSAWNAYGESINKDSVKMVLKNTELQLEGETVVALVGNSLAENTLRQENRLMEFIRKELSASRLSLDIKMDASKAPAYTPPPKPLTNSEKFWRLKQENPEVEELRKRFDLQFEE